MTAANLEDLGALLTEAADYVFTQKRLGSFERLLYAAIIVWAHRGRTRTFDKRLTDVANTCGFSEFSARKFMRELHKKRIISIDERGRFGYRITVNFGGEIDGVIIRAPKACNLDIDALDFYTGRVWLKELVQRQSMRCLYSLKALALDTVELDHIIPLSKGGDNSYKNICACSFEMNKLKGDMDALDFLQKVYRDGFLTGDEFMQQRAVLVAIRTGELKPDILQSVLSRDSISRLAV